MLVSTRSNSERSTIAEINRTEIQVSEYGEARLPAEIVRPDGTLDLYEDIQTRFEIAYKRRERSLVIRAGGWIGYIPLNEHYALRIRARVPIYNLEKVISRSVNAKIAVLHRYSHLYRDAIDRPQALHDLITDQFLASLELIWREGLAKDYFRDERQSLIPHGRIDPFRTAVATERKRQPRAHYSAFFRTADYGPNRVIQSALQRLLQAYRNLDHLKNQSKRVRRLREAATHLNGIGFATANQVDALSTERFIRRLPPRRMSYIDALRLSRLINNDLSVDLRRTAGITRLPIILVDMAHVFECYVRETLHGHFRRFNEFSILDGNISGETGAKRSLFNRLEIEEKNPPATPDIVIERDEEVVAVIDVKYKPERIIPERSEINQIICYGARYACSKVMIVYPEAPANGHSICLLGEIGTMLVYRANLDLNAANLEQEEHRFAQAVMDEL